MGSIQPPRDSSCAFLFRHSTKERRTELAKIASKYTEDTRVAVRNVRRHAMDDFKRSEKENLISQDQHRDYAKDIQTMTDEFMKRIDDVLAAKEKEIMQV